MVKNQFDIDGEVAPKNGTLIFNEVGFEKFIHKLEHWYRVSFHIVGTPPIDTLNGMKYNYDYEGKNITISFLPKKNGQQ